MAQLLLGVEVGEWGRWRLIRVVDLVVVERVCEMRLMEVVGGEAVRGGQVMEVGGQVVVLVIIVAVVVDLGRRGPVCGRHYNGINPRKEVSLVYPTLYYLSLFLFSTEFSSSHSLAYFGTVFTYFLVIYTRHSYVFYINGRVPVTPITRFSRNNRNKDKW